MADIPVNAQAPQTVATVVVDGQTDFDFDFRVDALADLSAIYVSPAGVETILVHTVDFTASGLGVATGGTLSLVSLVTEEGGSLLMYRSIEIARPNDFSRDLFAAQLNQEQDKIFMILQEQNRDLGRSLKAPIGQAGYDLAPDLAVGDTLMIGGDRRIEKGPNAAALMAAEGYAEAAGLSAVDANQAKLDAQAAAASLNFPPLTPADAEKTVKVTASGDGYEYVEDPEDPPQRPSGYDQFNIIDYGGAAANTTAQNKTALQAAIAACDAAGGGTVLVPWPIDYGYDPYDEATYPDFAGVVNDMMILDQGPAADGYTSEGAKQGWMEKRWYHTPQTTLAGQHDGNGFRIFGDWHPYAWVAKQGGYIDYGGGAGGRDANYNHRASYFLGGPDGHAIWQICNGVTQQGNLSDEELSDFGLVAYKGGVGAFYPLIVDYTDGSAVYGLGTSYPQAAHHFHHPATVTGKATVTFSCEPGTDLVHMYQRGTSYDVTRDVRWRLTGSQFNLEFPNIGNAIQIERASRNITFGGSIAKASGTFLIDHPLRPTEKDLAHGFVEAPRYELIYRGDVKLKKGRATVDIDAEFKMESGTFAALTYGARVTSLQNQDSFARLRPGKIDGGKFEIICEDESSTDTVTWVVIGERNDAFVRSGMEGNTDENGRFIVERDKPEADEPAAEAKSSSEAKPRKAAPGKRLVEVVDAGRVGRKGCARHPEAFGEKSPMMTIEVDDEIQEFKPVAPNPPKRRRKGAAKRSK